MPSSTPRPLFDCDEVGDDFKLTLLLLCWRCWSHTGIRGGGQKGGLQSTSHHTRPDLRRGLAKPAFWDITTEERLLGILERDTYSVRGVRFSLNATRLATASTTTFASSTTITTKTYHTLLLPDHAACVVKQRGANLCHIGRQQS